LYAYAHITGENPAIYIFSLLFHAFKLYKKNTSVVKSAKNLQAAELLEKNNCSDQQGRRLPSFPEPWNEMELHWFTDRPGFELKSGQKIE